jgi:multisubunit Na+/H+ antiporter MnhB subunit
VRGSERSPILDITVDVIFHTAMALALYFLFVGHNSPGGGFIGGLVAGAALVLRELTGRPQRGRFTRVDPLALMGVGMLLAAGTGMASWLIGNDLFESGSVSVDLPVLGTATLYSVLAFDTGVFCVVVGLVMAELDALGGEGA